MKRDMISSRPSPTRTYLLRESILLLALAYWLLFGSSQAGLLRQETLTFSAMLLSVVAIAWVIFGQRTRTSLQLPVLTAIIVLFLTALTSIDPARSLPEAWLISLELLLVLLVADLVGRGWQAELFVKVLLIIGAIVSLLSWMEALSWYLAWLRSAPGQWIPAVSYRLPAPNMLAVFFNLLLMLAIARLLQAKNAISRLLLGIFIVSALGLLYLTSSRGGWLGTFAGLLTLFVLHATLLRRLWSSLRAILLRKKWLPWLAGLLLLVVLAAGGWMLYRQAMQPTHGNIFTSRASLWGPAWQSFLRSPWLGEGPFTFGSAFLRVNSVPPAVLFIYAHNLYLDVLSGSGLLGFAAFAFLAVMLVRALLRRLSEANGTARAVVAGALAGLAAFGVHGIFDSVHHTEPTCAMLLTVILGAALGSPGTASGEPSIARPAAGRVSRRMLPALMLLLAGGAWLQLWQNLPFYIGERAANTGDWPKAADAYRQAVQRNPRSAAAYQQLGLATSQLVTAGDETALPVAIAAFQRASEIDPAYSLHPANLGALYLVAGDASASRQAFEDAVGKAPQADLFWLNLGMACEADADPACADQAYRTALELQPFWSETAFWQGSALRAAALAGWQEDHPPATAAPLENLEAAYHANRSLPGAYIDLARAYLDLERLEDVARILEEARFSFIENPWDALHLLELRLDLAGRQGDENLAAELQAQVQGALDAWGLYGPGSYGIRLYTPYALRKPGMRQEVVEEMSLFNNQQ